MNNKKLFLPISWSFVSLSREPDCSALKAARTGCQKHFSSPLVLYVCFSFWVSFPQSFFIHGQASCSHLSGLRISMLLRTSAEAESECFSESSRVEIIKSIASFVNDNALFRSWSLENLLAKFCKQSCVCFVSQQLLSIVVQWTATLYL